jgi:hypothetical protein
MFEGKPLDEGTIQLFSPGGLPTPVAGARIVAGKYEIPRDHGVPPGTYLVRISSTEREEIPAKGNVAMSSFRIRERIASRYNTSSTLSVVVPATGGSSDFNLE